jgi:heme a synthase
MLKTLIRTFSKKSKVDPGFIPRNAAPRSIREEAEPFNPIIFNRTNELYVLKGKERAVGLWLLGISASIFGIVVVGGFTRLTKSGLSMVRWEPHRILPPIGKEEWEKEFEEYKQSPEWINVNSKLGMELDGFKKIFYWEWGHRILGRSIGFTFFVPMVYFWARGYLQNRLKFTLVSLFGLGGIQGAIGWWMVKSGLVDKKNTKELDKTPRVSPYRLATHAGFAYSLYSICLW